MTGSAGPPPERARAAARLGLAGLLAGLALVAAVTPLGGAAHASRLGRASSHQLAVDPLIQQGDKLIAAGELGGGRFGVQVALSADGNTALFGGPYDNGDQGAAWVLIRSGGVWTQQGAKLTPAGGAGHFGWSVALSADGNTALIGCSSDDAAWVFTRAGGTWTQQGPKLTPSDITGSTAAFGSSVALSADGSTALIGGWIDNAFAGGIGAAWVFTRSGGTWTQQGPKLIPNDESNRNGANFGKSVALSADGNTALIAGPVDNFFVGAAWVFTRSAGAWAQQGPKLTVTGAIGESNLGDDVALSADGNMALIGGSNDNPAGSPQGAAWVFTRSGGTWTQGPKLTGSGEIGQGGFGGSVALSAAGDVALVGGGSDNDGVGAAWVLTRSGGTWTQQGAKLTGGGEIGNAFFGGSVALSADGSTAVVGAPNDNDQVGAAWAFTPALAAGLYWTNGGGSAIGRANVDGTGVNQSQAVGANLPRGIAFNARYVYWANSGSGTIGRANLDGTGADQSFVTGAGSPIGVALDGQHLYWANSGNGTIGRALLDGTGVNQSFVTGAGSPTGVAVDGQHLYWANSGNGTIGRALLNGSSPNQSFITGANQPAGVAVDPTRVYWANGGSGTIGRAFLDGTGVDQSFIGGATGPRGVAVAGPFVYWANSGNGTIGRASLNGSSPNQSFVTGANQPWGLAVQLTVPSPPIGVSGVPGNGQATVSFTPPASNGGTAIASYTVTASPGNATASGPSSPIVVPGLTNGTAYTFTVTATNAVGTGGASSPSAVVTPATVPGAPTGVSGFRGNGLQTVTVTFSPPAANGGAPIDHYTVTASPGGATASGPISGIALYDLPWGTYTFTVRATNAAGTGPASAPSAPITVATAPDPPADVSAVAGNGFAIVSFATPAANGAAISSYTVVASGGPEASGTASPLVVSGLTNGVTYTFTARATNSFGSSAPSAPSSPVTPTAGATWAHQGPKLTGTGGFGLEVGLSSDGSTALIGGPDDAGGAGAAWVFTRSDGVWSQQGAKLVGADENGAAGFGYAVALSADGNTALVGGPGDSGGAGAVWVFTRSGGVWSQGQKLSGGGGGFGSAVALSGDGNTALVGAPDDGDGVGAAWVLARSGGTWTQGAKLTGGGEDGSAGFGLSLALSDDGNVALVGGPFDNVDSELGAAWVFTRSGGAWSQQGPKLIGSMLSEGAWFGWDVALSGDGNTALMGGYPNFSTAGQAYVFARSGSVWNQQANLSYTGAAGGSYFGWSVWLSRDGNTALVGGPADNGGTGAAWVFSRFSGIWAQQGGKLTGTGESGAGTFGGSVALSADGTTAAVGGQDDNGGDGAVWMFTGPPPAPTGLSAARGNGTASVSFTASPGVVGSYTVTASPGGATVSGASSPIVFAGLTLGSTYTFIATATNATGTGPPSAPSNALTILATPGTPTAVTATGGDGGAVVSFIPPASNGGTPISFYTAIASPGGRGGSSTGSPIAVSGLTNGVSYTFTVSATNSVGAGAASSPSNAVTPVGFERPHPDPPAEGPRADVPAFVPPSGPRVPPPH